MANDVFTKVALRNAPLAVIVLCVVFVRVVRLCVLRVFVRVCACCVCVCVCSCCACFAGCLWGRCVNHLNVMWSFLSTFIARIPCNNVFVVVRRGF